MCVWGQFCETCNVCKISKLIATGCFSLFAETSKHQADGLDGDGDDCGDSDGDAGDD